MTFDKKKYDQGYIKENYDRIPIMVKKGEKAKIAECAKKKGFKSLNDYVKSLIYSNMEKESDINKVVVVENVSQNGDQNSINIG